MNALQLNYTLVKLKGSKRPAVDRIAALTRHLPWRQSTHCRLPADFRRQLFALLCCLEAREDEPQPLRSLPAEDVDGIAQALSVVSLELMK